MKFSIEAGNSSTANIVQAILIYGGKDRYRQQQSVFATLHNVANVGTKTKPNVQLLPGSPATPASIIDAMGSLATKYALSTELLPENVLTFSPSHLIWWVPATKRRVFFNTKELGNRTAEVPHPPLLFTIVGGAWSVYALTENKRPSKESIVCHAPYFNVYDGGNICAGTADIPKILTPDSIQQWEKAFFDSEFTHINGSIKKASHPRGEYALWKELLDGEHEAFPTQYLIPTKSDLGSLLKSAAKTLGGANG